MPFLLAPPATPNRSGCLKSFWKKKPEIKAFAVKTAQNSSVAKERFGA